MIENPDVCARIIISNYDALENPYYGGGGAVAVHEIAIRLTRDHDVLVLTGGYPGAREGLIDGVRYRRVGGRRLGPRLGQLAFHAALVRLAMVLEHDVWPESFTPPFSTSFLPLVNRKPVVGVVHFLAGSQMRNRYHLPFDRIERFGLRFYGDVIAVSQSVARQVAETNPRTRIRVIHNGVTVPEQRAPAQGRAFVGYLGRIDIHQKGLDLLIRAFAEAPDLSLPLVIAGSGRRRETKRLRALIAASGAGDRIRLLGRISGREKSEFLNGARMIVTPSRHESFSLTALEALAWGAPLVTFDIEGFSWIPRLAARKVPPYEVRALSEALTDLAGDSDAREELACAGRKHARAHEWEIAASKYNACIAEVLDDGRAEVFDERHPLIAEIVARRKQCVFVSPHLDDAVFSAGSLISFFASRTDVTIATVFTRGGEPPETLSARAFVRRCGYHDTDELFRDRCREDRDVLARIGARVIHLDFAEAMWRRLAFPGNGRRILGRFAPELLHRYPTFRLHVAGGRVARDDRQLMADLALRLGEIVSPERSPVVFAPSAVGGHVDHVVVHSVCRELQLPVVFWSDYPYSLRSNGRHHTMKPLRWCGDSSAKRDLIVGYATQTRLLFGPSRNPPAQPEVYFIP